MEEPNKPDPAVDGDSAAGSREAIQESERVQIDVCAQE